MDVLSALKVLKAATADTLRNYQQEIILTLADVGERLKVSEPESVLSTLTDNYHAGGSVFDPSERMRNTRLRVFCQYIGRLGSVQSQ